MLGCASVVRAGGYRSNCGEFNGFEVNCAIKSQEFVEKVVEVLSGLPTDAHS